KPPRTGKCFPVRGGTRYSTKLRGKNRVIARWKKAGSLLGLGGLLGGALGRGLLGRGSLRIGGSSLLGGGLFGGRLGGGSLGLAGAAGGLLHGLDRIGSDLGG